MRSAGAITRPCCTPAKRIQELRGEEQRMAEDYSNLLRTLAG